MNVAPRAPGSSACTITHPFRLQVATIAPVSRPASEAWAQKTCRSMPWDGPHVLALRSRSASLATRNRRTHRNLSAVSLLCMKLPRVLLREEEAPPALPAEPKARDKGPLTPLPLCDVCMVIGRGGLRHGQAGAVGGGGGAFCNACRARFSRGGHRAPSTGIGTCFGGQCRSTICFPLCLGHETEVTVVPGQMPKTKDELPLGGTQTAVTHSCFLCDLLATQVARDGRPGCIAHCRPRR